MTDVMKMILRMATLAMAFLLLGSAAQAQLRVRPQTGATAGTSLSTAADPAPSRTGDYIAAVVNQELVTSAEVDARVARARAEASRAGIRVPPLGELRRQMLDGLIDERVILTSARDSGLRIEESEIDRAVSNVAANNQLSMAQLRDRLKADGLDYTRFRNNVKDQLMVERVREREVQARIKVSEQEIDNYIANRRKPTDVPLQYDIAQVLVTVPEAATPAVVAERQARAEAAFTRIGKGEAFADVAREISEDGNRSNGGEIGMRPADRLPDVFVNTVKSLQPGQVAPALLRTAAGFHILRLVAKQEPSAFSVTQTLVSHVLLRTSATLTPAAAQTRLLEFKRQILAGTRTFEQIARDNSEDGTAARGGDLGWVSPGALVPEFEEVMNKLSIGEISEPVISRFGVHLIQVRERRTVELDAKQQREQARLALREIKYEPAYLDWVRELRARAYVEMREPPQQ
ncbi:MAG: molecular chaperone SurA [Rhizobacter sp.]|nr:molecular chaperone SurA [Rhizobacter sp.]